jgi:hypothetical protein
MDLLSIEWATLATALEEINATHRR